MAVQFNTMKKENEDLKKENSALKEQLSKEIEKNALENNAIFGASTEGLLGLWAQVANPPVELEDDAQVETTEDRKKRFYSIRKQKTQAVFQKECKTDQIHDGSRSGIHVRI